MLTPEAVIFDLDGVLWHSSDVHASAFSQAFGEAGIKLPENFYALIAGQTTATSVVNLLTRFAAEKAQDTSFIQQLAQRKQSLSAAGLLRTLPDPEALCALDNLRTSGYKLALATSASRSTMMLFLNQLPAQTGFDATVCGEEVATGKPAPDIFTKVAARLRLPPSLCVVVEDSAAGIHAAHACKMNVIGYRINEEIKGMRLLARCGSLSQVAAFLIPLRGDMEAVLF